MDTTRRLFSLLLLAVMLSVTGCQKYAAAEVRRGNDCPAAARAGDARHGAHGHAATSSPAGAAQAHA